MFPFWRKSKIDTAADAAVQSIAQDAEQRSLADPASWLLDIFGAAPALSGVTISPSTAMRSTAVRACVEAISEAVGGLPLHVYERGDDGARNRASEHPAYALLHDLANDWTPASMFREQVTRDALLHGNGYGFINRVNGEPRELIRLRPDAVTVDLDPITSEPRYKLSDGTGQRYVDRRDLLHVQAPSIDGVKGASPVMLCREAIGVNMVIESHVARLFANQARPSGVLSFAKSLTADAAAKMKASWQAMTASGGTAVLDADAKYEALTLSSADAQTLELWQHSNNEIARVFRVPPHMIFELGRATWGNAAEMGATFLRFTLDRWLKAWQGEILLKLIDPEDRATFYAEFLTDDLLRADFATRATAYGQYRSMGVITANEVRAGLNLPKIGGGDVLQNPYTTTTTTKTEPAGGGNG